LSRPQPHAKERLFSDSVIEDQMALESDATREGANRYRRLAREAIERNEGAALKPAERLLIHWFEPLTQAISQEKRQCHKKAPGKDRKIYGPALMLVQSRRIAVATLHEVISQCMAEPQGVKATSLYQKIGRAVLAEANHDLMKRERSDSLKRLNRRLKRMTPQAVNWWAKKELDEPAWHMRVCLKLGAALMWLLTGVASTRSYDQPFQLAFHHDKRREGKYTVTYVRMDREVFEAIEKGHQQRETLRPRYLPMIVPPYPWSNEYQGGYIHIRTPFISKLTKGQKQALNGADLDAVYEGLNAVNATPWRINDRIYEIACELWHAGGGLPSIPNSDDLPLPPKPDDIDENQESLNEWKREARKVYDKNAQLRGERVEWIQKLNVAKRFKDCEAFWLPHQLDFRSRAYPIPPHLNHQGDDLSRGLLEFAESVPVDQQGHDWLLIHMANCCGHDKISYADRIRWARENMQTFLGWANDPLENTGWLTVEKPWQALAAAIALGDPDAASHLPIQIDGTCNGLQHYAALGRDPEGAAAVNMQPTDVPSDIYTYVAEATNRRVQQDARNGREEAQWISDVIDRKIVKQPTMTTVYGVTMVGAREQVYEQLDKVGLTDDRRYKASMYLSRIVLEAMREVCTGATAIMDWLQRCASQVAQQGYPVQWTTPLGLPIVQPYRRYPTVQVRTIMHNATLLVPDESVPVACGKQSNGFAPNFVHSIDGSHMLMTAAQMRRRGLDFAAVHDSYWCHAAHTDEMASILREQFIELHDKPLLANLRGELARQTPTAELPEPPETGEYDIRTVRDAPFFFS